MFEGKYTSAFRGSLISFFAIVKEMRNLRPVNEDPLEI